MFQQLMQELFEKKDLPYQKIVTLLKERKEKQAISDLQLAALLVAMKFKGENSEELLAFRDFILSNSLLLDPQPEAIDVCGTGGDFKNSFNVSSMTALVLAACGLKVAKHGNRAVSGSCGSADFYQELGIRFFSEPEKIRLMLAETNFVFLFAPLFHPVFKEFSEVRRQLAIPTLFNYLGPFVNPLQPGYQLIGCFSREALQKCAEMCVRINDKNFLLVHSLDGYDEISISAPSIVVMVKKGKKELFTINPRNFFRRSGNLNVSAKSSKENVAIFLSILKAESSAYLDMVLLNSAAALFLAGKTADLSRGIEMARDVIVCGKLREHFEKILLLQEKL